MKIVIDKAIPFIEDRFPKEVETVLCDGTSFNPEIVKDADALLIRTRTRCNASLLSESRVKVIATATIGLDHIDLPWCEKQGIFVGNAPGSNAPGVAQYVFASLFNQGFDPRMHTLGIIGYGNVGQQVAKWAREMGINLIISDDPRKEKGLKDIDYSPLEEVLRKSDAVTLHVPLTLKGSYPTKYLIGENELQMIRPGAILINSSRGGVVEEKALKPYLQKGILRAVIDVWENEPGIDCDLLNLVSIGTPHIAGYSAEGKKRGTAMALKVISDRLAIPVDLSGLECPSVPTSLSSSFATLVSPGSSLFKTVSDSYDIIKDSQSLKSSPSSFESLRNSYTFRLEPYIRLS